VHALPEVQLAQELPHEALDGVLTGRDRGCRLCRHASTVAMMCVCAMTKVLALLANVRECGCRFTRPSDTQPDIRHFPPAGMRHFTSQPQDCGIRRDRAPAGAPPSSA